MSILSGIILGLFLYLAISVGRRIYLFYKQYKNVINQFRNAQSTVNNAYSTQHASDNVQSGDSNQKKKIIPDDEGEYVEFEEVE